MKRFAVIVVLLTACTTPAGPATTSAGSTRTFTTSAIDSTTTTTTVPAVSGDGVSVTEDTIHIGLLADLSGPFVGQSVDAVDAQIAFWNRLNLNGGIGGRRVELHIADTGSDVETHAAAYRRLKDRVVMFSHSMGIDQTLIVTAQLGADQRLVVAYPTYSGWSAPNIGENVVEIGPSGCVEAINTIVSLSEEFEAETGRPPRLAVVSAPGFLGQDSVRGAKFAAQALGLDIVYDGEADVVAGEDISPVIAAVSRSGADLAWVSTDPVTVTTIVAGAVQLGFTGTWAGTQMTFDSRLMDTALGEVIAGQTVVSVAAAPLGAGVEGMGEVVAVLAETYPDHYPSEALVRGYLEYEITRQILVRADQLGDLTPRGVVRASRSIESAAFDGIAPAGLFADDPNLAAVRASGLATFDKGLFETQGGLDSRLMDGAISPLMFDGVFVATDVATRYDFTEPCYLAG